MKTIINRKNNMFCIDRSKLSSKANKDEICNAIYAAIYREFAGAATNPAYKGLTNLQKMNRINEFVNKWLFDRGLN